MTPADVAAFEAVAGDLLDELGYEGWVGCEYTPKAGTLEGLGWRGLPLPSPVPARN